MTHLIPRLQAQLREDIETELACQDLRSRAATAAAAAQGDGAALQELAAAARELSILRSAMRGLGCSSGQVRSGSGALARQAGISHAGNATSANATSEDDASAISGAADDEASEGRTLLSCVMKKLAGILPGLTGAALASEQDNLFSVSHCDVRVSLMSCIADQRCAAAANNTTAQWTASCHMQFRSEWCKGC